VYEETSYTHSIANHHWCSGGWIAANFFSPTKWCGTWSCLFLLYGNAQQRGSTSLISFLNVSLSFLSLSLPLGLSNLAKLQLTAWPLTWLTTQRQRQMTVMNYRGSRVLQQQRRWRRGGEKKKALAIWEKWHKLWPGAEAPLAPRHLFPTYRIFSVVLVSWTGAIFWQNSKVNTPRVASAPADGAALPAFKTPKTVHSVFWVNKCTSTMKQPHKKNPPAHPCYWA